MRAADRGALGNLFNNFQQGWGFGDKIIDNEQRRRIAEQDNARQEKQLRMQMAQAQVAADKARQEMGFAPEEQRRKGIELEYKGKEIDLRGREQDFTELKYKEEPKRKRTEFLQAGLGKVAGAMDTPEAIVQTLGLPPEALNDSETLAEITEIAKQSRGTKLAQEITKSRLTTRAAEGERTVAQGERRENEARTRAATLGPKLSKDVNSVRELVEGSADPYGINKKAAASSGIRMLESEYANLSKQIAAAQNSGNTGLAMDYSNQAAALASSIEMLKAGLNSNAPAQQYQQPLGPQPAQQTVDPTQIQTWSPARKQAILNASTSEEMQKALLVP